MSEKEFFRELREEIKVSTAKMLEETDPFPENSDEQDTGSGEGAIATDPSEVDSGFQFVELVPSKKGSRKSRSKRTSKAEQTDEDDKTPEDLKQEITNELEKIKAKLQTKKALCHQLDGITEDGVLATGSVQSMDSKDDSVQSSKISKAPSVVVASGNEKNIPKLDPVAQKKYDKQKETMRCKIKEVQDKLNKLSLTANKSGNGISGATPAKQQKKSLKNSNKSFSNSSSSLNCSASSSTISSASGAKASSKRIKDPKKSQTYAANKNPVGQQGVIPKHLLLQLAKPDNMLLLTLLTMNRKQRDDYLVKVGKERALLRQVGQDKTNVEIIPQLVQFATDLKSRAMVHCYGPHAKMPNQEEVSRPFLVLQEVERIQEAKKVRESRTFEDEVSYLLNNGKTTEKKDYKADRTLENVSQAEKNGFLTEENKTAMGQLVDRLVAEGVGYITEGVLRVNVNNNAQAFVDDHTREADVFINSVLLRRCAMDGDFVKVFVRRDPLEGGVSSPPRSSEESDDHAKVEESEKEKPKNNWGFVMEILEKRHSRLCVGTFMPYVQAGNQYIKFKPRDLKIPVVRVYKQHWPEAVFKNDFKAIESVIYQAEIIDWQDDTPIGTILKSIGKCGELEVENQSILVEYDLDVSPYSEAIINSLPSSPFQIPKEEIEKREDLRDECIFTIDPLTARDLDDALSCKLLKNGNFEIGVHISDVSYFLKEGSELDELVKLRATSIYMVDNVYHMLPKPLCFLCSLLPGEDKLAFSVFWEITPNAKVLKTRFAKTIINSCTQLAYEHAQIMLNRPNENLNPDEFPKIYQEYTPNYLSRIVNQLQTIAVQLRARRMENGCLKINQPKLCFNLDPNTGEPIEFATYELRTANQMIEDFMLLANSSVAEFTHSKFADRSILRNHFAPPEPQIKNLAKLLAKHGHELRVDSSKSIAESIETIIASCPQPDAARAAMNIMIAKPMTRARYFCSAFASAKEEFYHYALAIPMYTHFTSPIRRYADCMVHRVLSASLELTEPPSRPSDELSKLTGICNIKKYNAKLAGDASSLLYFRHYLKKAKFFTTEGAVLDMNQHQIELVLIETGHVIKASYKQLAKAAMFKIVEDAKPVRRCILIPKDTKIPPVTLELFSKVRVTVQLVKDVITAISVLPLGVQDPQNFDSDSE